MNRFSEDVIGYIFEFLTPHDMSAYALTSTASGVTSEVRARKIRTQKVRHMLATSKNLGSPIYLQLMRSGADQHLVRVFSYRMLQELARLSIFGWSPKDTAERQHVPSQKCWGTQL